MGIDKIVFPTCVGMNRAATAFEQRNARIPHLCGDEPCNRLVGEYHFMYSPLVWG